MGFIAMLSQLTSPSKRAAPPREQIIYPNVQRQQVGQVMSSITPSAPQSLLAKATVKATQEMVLAIRAGVMAQAVREPVDDIDGYTNASVKAGVTPAVEATHIAAARSFLPWLNWPEERARLLELHNKEEARAKKAEEEHDIGLTKSRRQAPRGTQRDFGSVEPRSWLSSGDELFDFPSRSD